MLQFSKNIINDWQQQNPTSVSIEMVESGCAGTSIVVHTDKTLDGYVPLASNSPSPVYIHPKSEELLKDAHLTYAGGKWILSSAQVLHHCGCGKSFGEKTGDAKLDKIALLRARLKKSKKHH